MDDGRSAPGWSSDRRPDCPDVVEPQAVADLEDGRLACRHCAGLVALTPARREAGWFRCRYCDSLGALEPREADLLEGPSPRIFALQHLDRDHVIIPAGTLMSRSAFIVTSFILLNIWAMFAGACEVEPEFGPTGRVVGILTVTALAVLAGRWLHTRWRTEQHLEIRADRLRAWRQAGTWRSRTIELERTGSPFTVERATLPIDKPCERVVIRAPSGIAINLICSGGKEAAWLCDLLGAALTPEGCTRTLQCRNCGACLQLTIAEVARGMLCCPYCQGRLTIGQRSKALPPAHLPVTPALPEEPPCPACLATSRTEKAATWTIRPSRGRGWRWTVALLSGYGAIFFAVLGAILFAVTPYTPAGTVMLKVYTLVGGFILMTAAVVAARAVLVLVCWRDVIAVDAHALTIRSPWPEAGDTAEAVGAWLFGGALGRKLGLIARDRDEAAVRIPLALLTRIEFDPPSPADRTVMTIATERNIQRIRWDLDTASDARLRAELLEELGRRLRGFGRQVLPNP